MSEARVLESPIGPIRLVVAHGAVTQIDFHWEPVELDEEAKTREPLLSEVERALAEYFQKPDTLQRLPCAPQGTPFQLRVWQALKEIPLGQVMSYGELAELLGSSPRAVGGACRKNPVPLIIPCHRVVSKSGIGGFSGQWGVGEKVNMKAWLLQHERGL